MALGTPEKQQQWERRLEALARTVALGHALLGLLIMGIASAAALRIYEREESVPFSLLLWGVVMGGPQLLCALLAWRGRQHWASWGGIMWGLLFASSMLRRPPSGPMLVMMVLCGGLLVFITVRNLQLLVHQRAAVKDGA
jgi:hypothetical protein